MYKMNSTPGALNPSTRFALVFLGLCLLLLAGPCADTGAHVCSEDCDQDEMIIGPSAAYLPAITLLVQRGDGMHISLPRLLASRFPHPPIN